MPETFRSGLETRSMVVFLGTFPKLAYVKA